MLKPIREASREERLERGIIAIEALSNLLFCLPKQIEDSDWIEKIVGDIYSIAHVASARCCTIHGIELIEKIEKWGKEHKIYDVENVMAHPIREDHEKIT